MKVTLSVPALFPTFDEIGADDIDHSELDSLKRFLSCSSMQSVRNIPYESWLYGQFTGDILPLRQIPVANLTAMLDGLIDADESSTGCWMRADPVYLYPDTQSLVLQDPQQLNLQPDEIDRIRDTIAPLLESYDAALHTPHCRRWYLWFAGDAPDLICTPVHEALMRPVHQYLPQGRDLRRWHTLLNEIQMVLATLDVNLRRQEQRQLPVNSLWFWGNGRLSFPGSANYDYFCGGSELLESLCMYSNSCYSPIGYEPDDSLAVLGDQVRGLVVYESLLRARQLNDPGLWLSALQNFECEVIAPLVRRLRGGGIRELLLVSDSGLRFVCSRRRIHSFWRRMRPVSRYLLQ